MNSPLQAIEEWYKSLPPAQRKEIAAFIAVTSPEYGELKPSDYEAPEPLFLAQLGQYTEDKLRQIGVALGLRARIDHFFAKRGTREDWDETQVRLAGMIQHLDQDNTDPRAETLKSKLEHSRMQIPLRREQWIKTIEKWNRLCDGELSADSLDAWWAPKPDNS
jgi:hypothetical protein